MSFDSLSAQVNLTPNWNVSKNGPSAAYSALTTSTTLQSRTSYSLGTGAGAINQVYSTIIVVPASGSAIIDLTSLSNVLNQTFGFSSVKSYMFELLSPTQDSVNGTTAASVVVGGALSNPNPLNMSGTGPSFTLFNGDAQCWKTAAATGVAVNGSAKNVQITNNSSSVAAAVRVTLYGNG